MKISSWCYLALGLGLGTCVSAQTLASQPEKKMNVVFFLVDDMGWSDVGYEGSQFYETPNIDQFAKQGVRFSQAYAACSVCSPSRASILTGEYPARLHLTDYLPGRLDKPFQKEKNAVTMQHLPYDQPTLPEVLKENGYRTAIFGKWHLGEDTNSTQRQGFELHIPDWNKGWPNDTYFSPYGMKGLEGGVNGEYLTDRLTTEALKWITTNKDKPFFLYLANFAVHDPIQGRGDLVVKYDKKLNKLSKAGELPRTPPYILEGNPDDPNPPSQADLAALLHNKNYQGFSLLPRRTVKIKQHQDNTQFAAMVESTDESLGRVLAKLKELGIADNTVVIFFSDNGGMSGANFFSPRRVISPVALDKAYATSNLPLRGGKGWLYEGGIREPLIIYWPQASNNGTACDVPVISTDFYSTILDLVGLRPLTNKENGVDGRSLVPLLKQDQAGADQLSRRALYWHYPHYSNHGAQSPCGAVRSGDYKLIEYYENNAVQLFNIKTDPGEQHDLAQTEPDKVKELTAMLHDWRKSVNADMPTPNPNWKPNKNWPAPSAESVNDDP
ncbi:MAG TPA: sulfatase [Verrucomicrobiae bacterium]|jgi:arylsulfatase A-like enzyme